MTWCQLRAAISHKLTHQLYKMVVYEVTDGLGRFSLLVRFIGTESDWLNRIPPDCYGHSHICAAYAGGGPLIMCSV